MNVKTWIPLALAIVLGLIAAKVASDTLVRNRGAAQGPAKSVNVVVARVPVAPGEALTAEMLTLGPISGELPPPNSFAQPGEVVGRVAAAPLLVGQPVVETLLAAKGAAAGLQALVPRGMRAITVEVNETTGLAGMIVPGCHVDVVSTLNGAHKEDTVACTIVQDVLVQAVGQRLTAHRGAEEKEPAPVRSVTLIATPRDAEAIELASSTGRTRLVLRGAHDRALSDTTGITFVELRGDESMTLPVATPVSTPATQPATMPVLPPVQPPVVFPVATTQPVAKQPEKNNDPFGGEDPRPRRTVTLIRGGSRSEVVFEMPPPAKAPQTQPSHRPWNVPQPAAPLPEAPATGNAVTSTNEGGAQQ